MTLHTLYSSGLPPRVCTLLKDPLSTSWRQLRKHCTSEVTVLTKCLRIFRSLRKKEENRLRKPCFEDVTQKKRQFFREQNTSAVSKEEPFVSGHSRKRRYSSPVEDAVQSAEAYHPEQRDSADNQLPQKQEPMEGKDVGYDMMRDADNGIAMYLGARNGGVEIPLIQMGDEIPVVQPIFKIDCTQPSDAVDVRMGDGEEVHYGAATPELVSAATSCCGDSPSSSTGVLTPPSYSMNYEAQVALPESTACPVEFYLLRDDAMAAPLTSRLWTTSEPKDPYDPYMSSDPSGPHYDGQITNDAVMVEEYEPEKSVPEDVALALLAFQVEEARRYKPKELAWEIEEEFEIACMHKATDMHEVKDAGSLPRKPVATVEGKRNDNAACSVGAEDVLRVIGEAIGEVAHATDLAGPCRRPASEKLIWGSAEESAPSPSSSSTLQKVDRSSSSVESALGLSNAPLPSSTFILDIFGSLEHPHGLPDFEDDISGKWIESPGDLRGCGSPRPAQDVLDNQHESQPQAMSSSATSADQEDDSAAVAAITNAATIVLNTVENVTEGIPPAINDADAFLGGLMAGIAISEPISGSDELLNGLMANFSLS